MKQGAIVLFDTNIVIEAIRSNCWKAITGYFRVATVEKCVEEANTGRLRRRGYVAVGHGDLARLAIIHKVSTLELAKFSLSYPDADRLDDGERHLWSHALGRSDAWLASCADKAAFRAAHELMWTDRIVSLQKLAETAGARPRLKEHFSEKRLSQWRTEFKLAGLR